VQTTANYKRVVSFTGLNSSGRGALCLNVKGAD